MPAETLNCPMCGAAASSDSVKCDHCGARLATVACPACFGMIFQGAKFCSHCGARVDRTELDSGKKLKCPDCKTALEAVAVGQTSLLECAKCEGLWLDAASFQDIVADREKQAAVLGMPISINPSEGIDYEKFHYRPCPVCANLMNRIQFAQCSHVIIDVCRLHGTWFDRDELRRIVEFIRAGGLDKSRQMEIENLKSERLKNQMAPQILPSAEVYSSGWRYDGFEIAIGVIWAAIKFFLK